MPGGTHGVSPGEPVFLSGPGGLSVARQDVLPTLAAFPTGHYHGITVTVDPGLAPRCLSCFLEDVEVQPAALAEKFCAAGGYFAAQFIPGGWSTYSRSCTMCRRICGRGI